MCVIASIYNTADNDKSREFLADNLRHFQVANGDGTAFYGWDTKRETKTGFLRALKAEQVNMAELLRKYNISHWHFRNATQGKVDENNIHFWRYKNWIMAHNGQVWNTGDYQNELSDSNLFFRELAKADCLEKEFLDINKINRIVCRKSFWGRLIFVNTETKVAYYFGDFYANAVDKNVLVISTARLQPDTLNIMGFAFQTPSNGVIEGKVDGIFKIDPKAKEPLKMYKLKFNEKDYGGYSGYNYGGYKSNYKDPYPHADLSDPDLPPEPKTKRSRKIQKQLSWQKI